MPVAQRAELAEERRRRRVVAALAQDRLDEDGPTVDGAMTGAEQRVEDGQAASDAASSSPSNSG